MSFSTFTVTVSELNEGLSEIWIASDETELMELLEDSLRRPGKRGLCAANVLTLVDTVVTEDMGSNEAADALWGMAYELGEFEGRNYVISFNYID